MARQLMPKAGIMMPYVVASREAAVVGVSTVDGKAGDILLDSTYLTITKANTDFAKVANTYTKTEVNNLLAPIISNAVIKTDPFINNNVPLRSGGGNGITSVDLIKADQNNQIVIGDLAAGVQGVNIYSNGRMSVVDKDDAGQTRVSPLYSKRYRPEIADMPFAAIGNYTLDSQGKVIGVTKTGINSDIKEFTQPVIVPNATQNTQAVNLGQMTSAISGIKSATDNFSSIYTDATQPAMGTVVSGGEVRSVYQIAGAVSNVASFKARASYGGKAMAVISVNDAATGITKEMTFDTNGTLIVPWIAAMGGLTSYTRDVSPQADRGATITASMSKSPDDTTKDVSFGFRPEWNKTDHKTFGVIELLGYDSSGTNLIWNNYWKFNKDGSASGPGPWVNEASDIRVKKDFKPIEKPFDTMRKIRAGTWRMNTEGNEGRFGIGVLANGLYDDYPEAAINTGSQKLVSGEVVEDVLTVQAGDSGVLAAVHHAAILELMKTVEDLKLEINQLKASQQPL